MSHGDATCHCEQSEAIQKGFQGWIASSLRYLHSQTMKQPAIYIMASQRNGTLYTGVTSNLVQRTWQHRQGVGRGFTNRYGCKRLVWYEVAETMEVAIAREKQIKAGSRAKKLALIEALNPQWDDLFDQISVV